MHRRQIQRKRNSTKKEMSRSIFKWKNKSLKSNNVTSAVDEEIGQRQTSLVQTKGNK